MADDSYTDTAVRLGARLCRDALWDGPRCNWLGAAMEPVDGVWSTVHRAFAGDLYSGTAGIALILAALHRATGDQRFRDAADGAIAQLLSIWRQTHPSARAGFYAGWPGMAFALLHVGQMLEQEHYLAASDEVIGAFAADESTDQPSGTDLISGSAGAISGLLHVHARRPRQAALDAALRHGQHLIKQARRSEAGWSWQTIGSTPRDLTGFSHGAAGIAWALLELHRATCDRTFRTAAEEGFRYEQHYFVAEQDNWPDFRDMALVPGASAMGNGGAPMCAAAWCHGAPGIGLSRLRAYQLTADPSYRDQLAAAVRATLRTLSGTMLEAGNFSLCHGHAGNAELLVHAAAIAAPSVDQKTPPTLRIDPAVHLVARHGIERFAQTRSPWPCGVPGGPSTPGLMLGLAGISYFYLRLAQPDLLPSVLLILS